jgi:hypothetical protein
VSRAAAFTIVLLGAVAGWTVVAHLFIRYLH